MADVSLTRLFAISKPIGGREFLNPQAVYVDGQRGEVYVADTGNGRITIMSKDGYGTGGFNHKKDGSEDGSTEPVGTAVDSKGSVYVTDSSSNFISVYDYRGRFRQKFQVTGLEGEPPVFGRMAVDSQDNLYVVTRNKGQIYVLDPKGTLKRTIGSKGQGQGKFEMLADVAVDSKGNIYALDTLGSPTIQVFNPTGAFLFGFGVHATGQGNFAHPTSVEVDENGRVWTVDSFAQVVNVYDSQGQFLTDFGGFFFPIDLAYSLKSHRLYVLEKNGHRLLGFDVKQS